MLSTTGYGLIPEVSIEDIEVSLTSVEFRMALDEVATLTMEGYEPAEHANGDLLEMIEHNTKALNLTVTLKDGSTIWFEARRVTAPDFWDH